MIVLKLVHIIIIIVALYCCYIHIYFNASVTLKFHWRTFSIFSLPTQHVMYTEKLY